MNQAQLQHFAEDGYADLGPAVDPGRCAALLAVLRDRRRFGPELFLSEADFLADPRFTGVNPRPGRNLLDELAPALALLEAEPALAGALAALLGPGHRLLDRKLVCGVPQGWVPDWLKRRIAGNPVNNLGPYVRPEFRDVTYFYGIDFHQDIIDWQQRPADFVTLYVYLHAVGPLDAPLQLLAGSHLPGVSRFPHDLDHRPGAAPVWRYAAEAGAPIDCRPATILGGAGHAALWHACTLHGTQPHGGTAERLSLRYLIAKDPAADTALDAVNRTLRGPLAAAETRADLAADGAPALAGNAINRTATHIEEAVR
ncbi:MAG: hypothetical protein HKM95_05110 [Inquilinus sp.]|nr:hypothetical protein [Inquilinus sp.]